MPLTSEEMGALPDLIIELAGTGQGYKSVKLQVPSTNVAINTNPSYYLVYSCKTPLPGVEVGWTAGRTSQAQPPDNPELIPPGPRITPN